MHTKEVITKILESKGSLPDRDLLVSVMLNEPRRPISMAHFQDCLDRLSDEKKIDIFSNGDGRMVKPLETQPAQ